MIDLKNRPIHTVHFHHTVVLRGNVMNSADVNQTRPALQIEESPRGIVLIAQARGETPMRVVLVPWSNVADVLYGDPA